MRLSTWPCGFSTSVLGRDSRSWENSYPTFPFRCCLEGPTPSGQLGWVMTAMTDCVNSCSVTHESACLSACLSVNFCPPVCIFFCLPVVCMFANFAYLPVFLFVNLPHCLSVNLSVCLSVYEFDYLPVFLLVCVPACLCIYCVLIFVSVHLIIRLRFCFTHVSFCLFSVYICDPRSTVFVQSVCLI